VALIYDPIKISPWAGDKRKRAELAVRIESECYFDEDIQLPFILTGMRQEDSQVRDHFDSSSFVSQSTVPKPTP